MRPTHGVLAYQKLGPRSNAAATATGARKLIGTEIRCSSHCYCNYCSRLQQRAPFPRGTLTNIKILSPLLWNSTLELPKHTLLKTNVQSALFFFAGTDKAQIERNMKTQMLKWLRASAWTRKKRIRVTTPANPLPNISLYFLALNCVLFLEFNYHKTFPGTVHHHRCSGTKLHRIDLNKEHTKLSTLPHHDIRQWRWLR